MGDEREVYKNRDMLLGEIHENSKNTAETLKNIKEWCKEHDKKDDNRFLIGVIGLGVVAFYAGAFPQLLKVFHIG